MSVAEIVKYFYEVVISENRVERISEFVSPECCVKVGENLIHIGVEGMIEHITATKQTYPDYSMKIIKQYCDGEYVISEFIMEGTHGGEWIGIKPTHKKLSFTGVDIDRVISGKIVEHGGAVNTFEALLEADLITANANGFNEPPAAIKFEKPNVKNPPYE